MPIFRRDNIEEKTNAELKLLNNRLSTVVYNEDILESVGLIYDLSLEWPKNVFEICFEAIYTSLSKVEEKGYFLRIFQSISLSVPIENVIKRLTVLEEFQTVILSQSEDFVLRFFRLFNNKELINLYCNDSKANEFIRKAIKSKKFDVVSVMIESNMNLKETLVFEGILEELIEKLKIESKYDPGSFIKYSSLIKDFVKDSAKNQYYLFNSTEIISFFNFRLEENIFQIYNEILDFKSKYLLEAQNTLFTPEVVEKSLELKKYSIVYKLIYTNQVNFSSLLENYLNIEQLLIDAETDLNAYKIAEYLIRSTQIEIKSDLSYRINVLKYILGQENVDLTIHILSAVQHDVLNIDQLIYLLFVFNEVSLIANYSNPLLYDYPGRYFWILFNSIHKVPMNISVVQVIEELKEFRSLLLEKPFTLDCITEDIISTIGQVINENTSYFEQREYTIKKKIVKGGLESNSDSPVNENKEEVSSATVQSFKENFRGFFSKFKISKNDRQNYDL